VNLDLGAHFGNSHFAGPASKANLAFLMPNIKARACGVIEREAEFLQLAYHRNQVQNRNAMACLRNTEKAAIAKGSGGRRARQFHDR
jgi:hypothetical protein